MVINLHHLQLKRTLALVLIHDLLFTKRGITVRNDVPLKQCVIRHQSRLKAELTKIKIKRGATSNEDLVSQKVKDAGEIQTIAGTEYILNVPFKSLFLVMHV